VYQDRPALEKEIVSMNSSFCLWLADIEDTLWRMVQGVFHFAFLRLPEWVYRTLIDTVGPATVRLFRALAVFSLWLAIVFGPVIIATKVSPPFWGDVCAAAWLVLAIVGSIWGRYRLTKKRCAAGQMADADRPSPDEAPYRPEYAARY
jgi:thiol:disulfide interchange protein